MSSVFYEVCNYIFYLLLGRKDQQKSYLCDYYVIVLTFSVAVLAFAKRDLRYLTFPVCSLYIAIQLLQFEPSNAHRLIEVTVLLHTNLYIQKTLSNCFVQLCVP